MRQLAAVAAAVALLGSASLGFAQKDDGEQKDREFYDFEQHVVDGEIQAPKGEYVDGDGDVEFDKVRNIEKKSFLDVGDSSDEEQNSEE